MDCPGLKYTCLVAILLMPGCVSQVMLLGCLIAVHVVPRPLLHGMLKRRLVVVTALVWLAMATLSMQAVQLQHSLKLCGVAAGLLFSRMVLWLELQSLKHFEGPLSTEDLRSFVADYLPTPAEVVDVLGDRVLKFGQNELVLRFLRHECRLVGGRITPHWLHSSGFPSGGYLKRNVKVWYIILS